VLGRPGLRTAFGDSGSCDRGSTCRTSGSPSR